MTVKIRKGVFKLKIWLPTRMAVGLIICTAKGEIEKRGFKACIKRRQKQEIKKTVLKAKKDFGKLELLSVKTSDKFEIKITL